MVITESDGVFGVKCGCCDNVATVLMWNYAESEARILLCRHHALQLSRKLLEDLCELAGDRHG